METKPSKTDTGDSRAASRKDAGKKTGKPSPLESYYSGLPSQGDALSFSRGRQPRRVLWSIAWSDLMMTMFILFAMLYIYQAANREFSFLKQVETDVAPEAASVEAAPPQVETIIESLDALAAHRAGGGADTVRLQQLSEIGQVELEPDKAVRIILPGDLLFDTGRADLKPSALETLRQVADAVRITDYRVNVVGHTDSVPMHSEKFATNWELSAIRACAVARYLIEQTGLSPARFYISAHAYLQPVAPNDTPANRSANRRVELIMTQNRPEAEKGLFQ